MYYYCATCAFHCVRRVNTVCVGSRLLWRHTCCLQSNYSSFLWWCLIPRCQEAWTRGKKRSFNWNIKEEGRNKNDEEVWGINGCNLCCFSLHLFLSCIVQFQEDCFSWKSADWMWVWLSSKKKKKEEEEEWMKRFLLLYWTAVSTRLDSIRCAAVRVTRRDTKQSNLLNRVTTHMKSIQVCTQEIA